MTGDGPRLAIDTDAEAALRAAGELEGPWQVPSELARRAFRAGARRVAVSCHRSGFTVRDDGAPVDTVTRSLLERALDREAAGREDALARLESGPHAELRFLAALGAARIALAGAGSAVSVSGLRWDPGRGRQWLRSAGRFAGPALELDGQALMRHEPPSLASAPVASPPGQLWLRDAGEDGAIWVLRDRMLAAFLVVPGSLPFEAVLDLSAGGNASAASLRERIAPVVPSLADEAARLICEAAARVASLDPASARRLRALVLETARLRRWRGQALRAAVYPARVGAQSRWLSLSDLGSPAVAGPDRRLATCAPDDVARALFLTPAPVVVLDADERARLAQELGLRFSLVPHAEGPAPRTWRRAWARFRSVSRGATWDQAVRG